MTGPDERRYGALAILLHWTIAALILLQVGLGWWMNHVLPDHSPAQRAVESLHVSIGLTTLLFILARIGVRLISPPPPLAAGMGRAERALVRAAHLLFYVLMLALPLTGWLLVSTRHAPIGFWGLGWPKLPGLAGLAGPDHRALRHDIKQIHAVWLVWLILANLALHVAGALKHQFDGHPVLWKMAPFLRPPVAR